MQKRFTAVSLNNSQFGFWVQRVLSIFVEGVRYLDRWLMPVSKWQWIGKGDVLYRCVTERHGFQFIGELVIDRSTFPEYLGTFGETYQEGAEPVGNGTFFYPVYDVNYHISELVRSGSTLGEARKIAPLCVEADMQAALSYGKTWFIYGLVVSAKRGNSVLAEVSLWGLDARPQVDRMDPHIETLYQAIIPEVERSALDELKNLVSLRLTN